MFKYLRLNSSYMWFLKWVIKHMKSDPNEKNDNKQHFVWVVDENKCFKSKEVKKLRAFCNNAKTVGLQKEKFSPVRDWFMVELGLNAGLRVSEMASLKHKNLLLKGDRSSMFLVGKGNKPRTIWVSAGFRKTCETYIKYKQKFGFEINEEAILLNSLKGNEIAKRCLQKFFKNILKKANLPSHYYIHCLRHTYTTFLLKASNHNYRFAQKQLGHSSITITEVYASVIETDGRKAVEKIYK